ncbi:hypothetical protein O0I10_006141 [Lichtheimia ornata]|uniref:Uncharacterized protein n=1 Tax=Lichtheimia ornata TaxID=688661 RepID=A0AAD7V2H4_9FUNG|nr:uncharacterized protein O0I10_006141 [Lichtheimia ornata]KAJ8658134.1 hypothetical protein O0I10_006141 [Lichtheimia ornata]
MSQPTSISGADTQAQSSPEPISLGSPISIQAASSMGDWDTASISQLLEEPMDLDFGMDQALSANSVLSSNISFHDTSNTPTTPETSVQANSQLPTGTIHSIHASSETLLDNAITQYKQQLDELIKTYTRAMAAGNRNHLKRLFSEIHQTKHLLKSFRKLKEEEYGNHEPKNKPTITQAKLSVRDIPPFQLKDLMCGPDKEVFESAVHFLSSFQKVLNTGSVNKDLEWQKWLHVVLHQDHDEWFESELADKGYTWEQAKVVFKKRFQSMD